MQGSHSDICKSPRSGMWSAEPGISAWGIEGHRAPSTSPWGPLCPGVGLLSPQARKPGYPYSRCGKRWPQVSSKFTSLLNWLGSPGASATPWRRGPSCPVSGQTPMPGPSIVAGRGQSHTGDVALCTAEVSFPQAHILLDTVNMPEASPGQRRQTAQRRSASSRLIFSFPL